MNNSCFILCPWSLLRYTIDICDVQSDKISKLSCRRLDPVQIDPVVEINTCK